MMPESSTSNLDPPQRKWQSDNDNSDTLCLYTGWTEKATDLVHNDFVRYEYLTDVLRALQRQNFSVKAMRDEAMKMLDNIPVVSSIASPYSRFPTGLYVNVSDGIVADLLHKLRCTYDVEARYLTHCAFHLKVIYINRILELSRYPLSRLCIFGIYSRDSFEASLNLRWGR